MANKKVLRVRKLNIDVIPNAEPFIEIIIQILFEDPQGNVVQVVDNWGRIYRRLSDFFSVPLTSVDKDGNGIITPDELMGLVGMAAMVAVQQEYNGTFDANGRIIIQ